MNEKFLNQLLASAVRRADIPLELDDMIVDLLLQQPQNEVPENAKARVRSKLRIKIQDAAIARASKSLDDDIVPFGQFIGSIRERAGLTRSEISTRLRKDDDYVERLERGHLNPIGLPTGDLADIVELFALAIRKLPKMVAASNALAGAKQGYRAVARSHGGVTHGKRGEDVERALEAFARTRKPKEQGQLDTDEKLRECVSKLEVELKRRGRHDLLE